MSHGCVYCALVHLSCVLKSGLRPIFEKRLELCCDQINDSGVK